MFKRPNDPQTIAELIGYRFKNEALLARALTRRSAFHAKLQDRKVGDFQTLEWVGDKVLDLIVSVLLKSFHQEKTEGQLTQLRVNLVKNDGPLPRVARHLGLDKFIIHADNEEITEKKLADHMEALLGAIFEDSGENYEIVKDFIANKWSLLGLNQDNLSVSDFGNESLIESSDVSAKREEQLNRALLKAAIDNPEKIDLIMHQGAYIEARNEEGNTAVLLAYIHSNTDLMQYLYEEHRANIDAVDKYGVGLIHHCSLNGDTETLDFLIENAADLNLKTKNGNTAAHLAAYNGHLEVIKKLFAAGADLTSENKTGKDVVKMAAEQGQSDIVSFISEVNEKQNQLNQSLLNLLDSTEGYHLYFEKDEIISLINAGADPFAKDKRGNTAFQIILEKKLRSFDTYAQISYALLKKVLPRQGADLTNIALNDIRLEQLDFNGTNLQGANFSESHLTNINFYMSNLSKANFEKVRFSQVDFAESDISSTNFTDVHMDRFTIETFILAAKKSKTFIKTTIYFSAIDLSDISLENFSLEALSFHHTRFNKTTFCSVLPQLKSGAVFKGTIDLRGIDFSDIDLTGISLENAFIDPIALKSLLPQLRKKSFKLTKVTFCGEKARLSYPITDGPRAVLDKFDLSNLELIEVNFSAASLNETKLEGSNLTKADISGCDFSSANIYDTNFEETRLDKAALQSILRQNRMFAIRRALLSRITIKDASFQNLSHLDLTHADFTANSVIEYVDFTNSILKKVNFSNIRFNFVNFSNADLSGADLRDVTFKDAKFEKTNIEGVKLSGKSLIELLPYVKANNLSLKNIDLSGENLTSTIIFQGTYKYSDINFIKYDVDGINLNRTTLSQLTFLSLLPLARQRKIFLKGIILNDLDFSGIDLSDLDLTDITLNNVKLMFANLKGTILKNAKLKSVNLNHANLQNVDFTGCIFWAVKVQGAKFNGVTLTGAHLDKTTFSRLLLYARENIITLANINLSNTDKFFSDRPKVLDPFSLKKLELTNLNLSGVSFQDITNIDKRCLLSILPQVRNNRLTLKNICLDFELNDINFTGISLDGVIVNNIAFKSLYKYPNIIGLNLQGLRFVNGMDMKNMDFSLLNMQGVNFSGVKLNRTHIVTLWPLLQAKLVSLANVDLSGADLNGLNLQGVNFEGANLQHTTFVKSNLEDCNLTNTHIAGAYFIQTNLSRANFSKSTTIYYGFEIIRSIQSTRLTDFQGASLAQANLTRADWHTNIINLTSNQLSQVATLAEANLDKELGNEVSSLHPHLMQAPSGPSDDLSHKNENNQNMIEAKALRKASIPMPNPSAFPYFFSNNISSGQAVAPTRASMQENDNNKSFN